ncbi:MAG: RNA polymerase sigma factor [Chloroflexi bacterium]|nr:RNA polymerase sigma factor [Chloroflexota bacterium]
MAAFERLVEAYHQPVYNLTYRMLGAPQEAEDATQETFLRLYRRFDTYTPGRKFSSWLLTIASHCCIDRLRRQRGSSVSLEEIAEFAGPDRAAADPEAAAVATEREREVRQLLAELGPKDRAVVVLHYWYGLSYEEMAQALDCTVGAVKSRLHRARRTMAETLLARQEAVTSRRRAQGREVRG